MKLDPKFVVNIKNSNQVNRETWLNELPERIHRLAKKWNFTFLEIGKNLSYNFIALVKYQDEIAILKISPVANRITKEVTWYQLFSDSYVPKIFEQDVNEFAVLMEKIEPGISLKNLVKQDDEAATKIICQCIRHLQEKKHHSTLFKHIAEFENEYHLLDGKISPAQLSKAKSLFYDLTSDRQNDVVLHGDLHHDNILSSDSHWKIIDPHAYIGDPVFEIGPMIFNPLDAFPNNKSLKEIIELRMNILKNELPFDSQRIKAWAFCRTILAAAWFYEDSNTVPQNLLDIATTIDKLTL